jgi:phage-related minor tail protein
MALGILAVPYNFLSGFLLGLLAPVAAIAAIVAGIRLLTGQVPFLSEAARDSERGLGSGQLSLELVSMEQARERFEKHKEQIGGDLGKMRAEIQAIIEEARSEAAAAARNQTQEPAE